jgi:hypothetical protein
MADGILKVGTITTSSGSGTITLGQSGETITVPSGATFSATAGTMSGQNYPAFRAYRSTSQAIPNTTFTKIQFDTETFDTDSAYDNSTNYRFTPQVAGKYFFTTTIRMVGISTIDNYQVFLYKNGSIHSRFANGGTHAANPSNSVSDIVTMNGSTDYVEVFVYQTYGSDRNIDNGTNNTYFLGYRLGA